MKKLVVLGLLAALTVTGCGNKDVKDDLSGQNNDRDTIIFDDEFGKITFKDSQEVLPELNADFLEDIKKDELASENEEALIEAKKDDKPSKQESVVIVPRVNKTTVITPVAEKLVDSSLLADATKETEVEAGQSKAENHSPGNMNKSSDLLLDAKQEDKAKEEKKEKASKSKPEEAKPQDEVKKEKKEEASKSKPEEAKSQDEVKEEKKEEAPESKPEEAKSQDEVKEEKKEESPESKPEEAKSQDEVKEEKKEEAPESKPEEAKPQDEVKKEKKEEAPAAKSEDKPRTEIKEEKTEGIYSFALPDSWKGKYLIEKKGDGVALIHKASNEAKRGAGTLLTIETASEYKSKESKAKLFAYSDECLYYFIEPDENAFIVENEKIAEEYNNMLDSIDEIESMVTVREATLMDSSEMVIPLSDKIALSEEQCEDLDINDMWLARNEIYARHGYDFDDAFLKNHFEACSWYVSSGKKVSDSALNSIELQNVRLLKSLADSQECYTRIFAFKKRYDLDVNNDGRADALVVTAGSNGTVNFSLDGVVFNSADLGVTLNDVNTKIYQCVCFTPEHYRQMALMDTDADGKEITHYFDYTGKEVHFVGTVPGYTTVEYLGRDPFAKKNFVTYLEECSLIPGVKCYGKVTYSDKTNKFTDASPVLRDIYTTDEYVLATDIEIYSRMDENADTVTVSKGTRLYLVSSDMKKWVRVKSPSGLDGYILFDDNGKTQPMNKAVDVIFGEQETVSDNAQ